MTKPTEKRPTPLAAAGLAAAVALGLSVPATALAQQAPPPQAPQQQTVAVSESELRTFAEATVEVQDIRAKYAAKLQTAADPQEQAMIQQTASQKMIEAVENKGLAAERYNVIDTHVRNNPDAARKVEEYMSDS